VPRGKTERQPLEEQFPKLKRYLVTCSACHQVGRDAKVDWASFQPPGFGPWITEVVNERWYPILALDGRGFCHECAAAERIAEDPFRGHS
jgi:mono/diheme cytochrome c family protein